MHRDPDTVTASELGDYEFCPEAARLARRGYTSANQPARDAGTTHHQRKATAEVIAGGSIGLGKLLVVVAFLIIVGVLLWR